MRVRSEEKVEWRRIRLALGLSQKQLGEVLLMEQGPVSLLESGKRCPDRRTVHLLRTYLAIPLSQALLARYGVPHPWPEDIKPPEPPPIPPIFAPLGVA